ncbi:MAG: hypothetical protein IPK16_07080 [Anaerolineales bacterium]|nr:hypothetical protein [Anaerolineales bacterium]
MSLGVAVRPRLLEQCFVVFPAPRAPARGVVQFAQVAAWNFCIVERLKYTENNGIRANRYFWRTYQQQKIDYIEERDGELTGFECRWNPARRMRAPKDFLDTYPGSTVDQIDRTNYWRYLMPPG